jgi:cation:H+ antiporter
LAISNIFGSNLIMLALLLPADMLYRDGTLLAAAGRSELLALIFGLMVTAIYVTGILVRRKPKVLGMGLDSGLCARRLRNLACRALRGSLTLRRP